MEYGEEERLVKVGTLSYILDPPTNPGPLDDWVNKTAEQHDTERYDELFKEIIDVAEQALRRPEIRSLPLEVIKGKCSEAADVVARAHTYLYSNVGDPDSAFETGRKSFVYYNKPQDVLTDIAKNYISCWYTSSKLEWKILNSMIYVEVVQFGESIKQSLPDDIPLCMEPEDLYRRFDGNLTQMMRERQKCMLKAAAFNYLVPPALGFGLYKFGYETGAMVVAGFYALGFIVRGLISFGHLIPKIIGHKAAVGAALIAGAVLQSNVEKKNKKFPGYALWSTMKEVYRLLDGKVLSPRLIKDELLKAREAGAVWNNAVFAMIDLVIERHPTTWVIEMDHYAVLPGRDQQ